MQEANNLGNNEHLNLGSKAPMYFDINLLNNNIFFKLSI